MNQCQIDIIQRVIDKKGAKKPWKNSERINGGLVVLADEKYFITQLEIDQEIENYEKETGKCHDCNGTGQAWYAWSKDEGNKYRDCKKCNSTGLPKKERLKENET